MTTKCQGSGVRVALSIAEAERRDIRCDYCGRFLKMRKGYSGNVGRSDTGWPETTIPRHNIQEKKS